MRSLVKWVICTYSHELGNHWSKYVFIQCEIVLTCYVSWSCCGSSSWKQNRMSCVSCDHDNLQAIGWAFNNGLEDRDWSDIAPDLETNKQVAEMGKLKPGEQAHLYEITNTSTWIGIRMWNQFQATCWTRKCIQNFDHTSPLLTKWCDRSFDLLDHGDTLRCSVRFEASVWIELINACVFVVCGQEWASIESMHDT